MKTFFYYRTGDSKKEKISVANAKDKDNASVLFAKIKGLKIKVFNKLFIVERLKNKNETKG